MARHDYNGELDGAESMEEVRPNYLEKPFQKEWVSYATKLMGKSAIDARRKGQKLTLDWSDCKNYEAEQEDTAGGLKKKKKRPVDLELGDDAEPVVIDPTQMAVGPLGDWVRAYVQWHYSEQAPLGLTFPLLTPVSDAVSGSTSKVPWLLILGQPLSFIKEKYFPDPKLPFIKEPTSMQKSQLQNLVAHWRARQKQGNFPFQFLACKNSAGNIAPANSPSPAVPLAEDENLSDSEGDSASVIAVKKLTRARMRKKTKKQAAKAKAEEAAEKAELKLRAKAAQREKDRQSRNGGGGEEEAEGGEKRGPPKGAQKKGNGKKIENSLAAGAPSVEVGQGKSKEAKLKARREKNKAEALERRRLKQASQNSEEEEESAGSNGIDVDEDSEAEDGEDIPLPFAKAHKRKAAEQPEAPAPKKRKANANMAGGNAEENGGPNQLKKLRARNPPDPRTNVKVGKSKKHSVKQPLAPKAATTKPTTKRQR